MEQGSVGDAIAQRPLGRQMQLIGHAIVLVSSDGEVRVPVGSRLRTAGAVVFEAHNSGEGVALPGMLHRRGHDASLVLLDMAIEDWSGLVLAATLRGGGYTGAILGLVTAAPQSLNGQQTCIEAGCNGVSIWPDESVDLVARCRTLLSGLPIASRGTA